MFRSDALRQLRHLLDAARLAPRHDAQAGIDARNAITRRRLLGGAVEATALVAAGLAGLPWLRPARQRAPIDIGIVGAGLAGLVCADGLVAEGMTPTVYEAGNRIGGRCSSLDGVFPGQVAERGGEFIDTGHKTMIALARRFGLALEDVGKDPGEVRYRFGGAIIPEAAVVAEFRAFVDTMRDDLRRISGSVNVGSHTPADAALDRVSLAAYLDGANANGVAAGPLARAAIVAAYEAEYGLLAAEQSCLNFLLFIHADRRGRFQPFGVFSDERYHVIAGNQRIALGLAAALPKPVQFGHRLTRISRAADGRIALGFATAGGNLEVRHEQVVVTLPFTVLRQVVIDPAVGIDPRQQAAIANLGYGTNAKMMIGLTGRPWRALGGNGAAYSDQPDHQASWETNPASADDTRAIITDYSSGPRGAQLDPARVTRSAERFILDCDRVIPGVAAAVRRVNRVPLAHLAHWPSDPFSRGSYTCYRPGQFTTIAGLEGLSAGNLHVAGEHTDSFDSWQGFMEGACLSGLRAVGSVLNAAAATAG